ncbi:MAG TPA: PilZ domain-containing protein [Vicinamibacteria bacterium]|nr:PilZ domain-containing protein [Vicinamibacteria bacterium]
MFSIIDRKKRLELHLAMKVRGADEGGHSFDEDTQTRNLSAGGLCFESRHHVPVGCRVSLEIAIPGAMRKHFGGQAVYAVNAVVCRVERFEDGDVSRVGARFIGHS